MKTVSILHTLIFFPDTNWLTLNNILMEGGREETSVNSKEQTISTICHYVIYYSEKFVVRSVQGYI